MQCTMRSKDSIVKFYVWKWIDLEWEDGMEWNGMGKHWLEKPKPGQKQIFNGKSLKMNALSSIVQSVFFLYTTILL